MNRKRVGKFRKIKEWWPKTGPKNQNRAADLPGLFRAFLYME